MTDAEQRAQDVQAVRRNLGSLWPGSTVVDDLADLITVAREQAWDEGAQAQAAAYGMAKDTGPNPYRADAIARGDQPGTCEHGNVRCQCYGDDTDVPARGDQPQGEQCRHGVSDFCRECNQ